ncbi:hypothetical protein C2G38_2179012 [Gigaspora rosea]|uniref:Uncharacterized protein n=1 Tax=Gigaspora rosea TaxID=44941 RepID=A0A397VEY0_9GLOM|nr:hypothetical protein C2G38_2179012 [Gigaspora rosea]
MCIECELNNKSFVVAVLSSAQNPLKSGFQCTCGTIKSNVEPHPSAAINACFENENIIQELIADIESFPIFLRIFEKHNVVITSIGDIYENKFHGVELECKNCITGPTPDDVWKQIGFYKNIPEHESPTCTPNDWMNMQKLETIFNRHIKSQRIPNAMPSWLLLFFKWYKQESTIIQFPLILHEIYSPEYTFQEKELRAWRSMFVACECTNVTPVPKKESSIEFWSKAPNPTANRK